MMLTTDEKYMSRCIQLARNGMKNAQPNPMVGAVIVYEGRIIGEGYHVRCGEGHAEVNACASVRLEDEHLLPESTIYVSLEPCSHYGKTPPCAELLVRKRFKRCVVGCMDPFAKVQGRGLARLREAGIELTVGVMEKECMALNSRFITFHSEHRPHVTLKWAESADGFIDGHISNTYTQMLCHKRRAENQAIMIGKNTLITDHPSLTVREWRGDSPKRFVVSSSKLDMPEGFEQILSTDINSMLKTLWEEGVQTVLVEGGAQLLQSFINSGLWDECYVERGLVNICGKVAAPHLGSEAVLVGRTTAFGNEVSYWRRSSTCHSNT